MACRKDEYCPIRVRRPGRPGFTVVELLVVVAILAVLLSIVTPSLQRARQLARRAVCTTQLRHQGLALATYADDGPKLYPPGVCAGPRAQRFAGEPDHGRHRQPHF